jgi:demethylmenaquinone methyltransferase / 2-methoxy-6-polyprenyl-1,4-benzoquinol methylase
MAGGLGVSEPDRPALAASIFPGIAAEYSRMGAVLSMGQDGRWRRTMVSHVNALPGSLVLDVASGTGLVARELAARKRFRVVALDPSEPMLRAGLPANELAGLRAQIHPVLGRAEQLPFGDAAFDAVTFTYLLRYVDDREATMRELARVLRPGGTLASLEFHIPDPRSLYAGWWLYTRTVLPLMGAVVSQAWRRTGAFLGPSISRFYEEAPLPEQVRWWQEAGITHVRSRVMSFGAGIVIWGVKKGGRGG